MSDYLAPLILGQHFVELPKSTMPASMTNNAGNYQFFCSSSEVKATDTWMENKPTVLMGTGGVASVNYGEDKFAYSTDTWAIRANSEDIDTKYLFRILQECLPLIDYTGFEGSGLRHLRKGFVKKLEVKVPSRPVQTKIVRMLDTIDVTILHTESLIEKYQQIKSGIMNDLFTRGVLPDGSLRPSREEAPDLYYDTPVGCIPKDWKYDYLLNLLAPLPNNMRSGPFGSALLKSELSENGIPFLGIDNIHVENFLEEFKRFVSEKKYSELIRYSTRPNDVVITIMGTVGRCCVIPNHIDKALSSKHLWTMTFDQNKVLSDLICWQLNYASWVKAWFRRETQGGIMDAIQSKTLKTLILPLPDDNEQKRIFERYKSLEAKIDTETQKLKKLQKQKSGLMHDLLTGEVRVTTKDSDV